jgi:MtN3 and saliva related transmembrane protein
MNPDLIGWAASAVLLATLIRQIVVQAKPDDDEGVSVWLFAGQIVASIGFVVYSVLVGNWVFTVTNSCILVTAIVGQIVTMRKKAAESATTT